MSVTVRYAGERDIPWMLGQLKEFDKFAAYGRSLIEDEEFATAGLRTLMKDHVVFLAEDVRYGAAESVGFIAAYKTGHPFNPKIRVLSECFWWVAECYRNSRAGLLLLNSLEDYGRRYCDWIVMSLEHVSPVNPNNLLRRGYKMKESSYLMEV